MSSRHHTVNPWHEVWLLDTGHFIVVDRVGDAWFDAAGWRAEIARRTVLRCFVAPADLANLTRLENSFQATKAFYEVADLAAKNPERAYSLMRTLFGTTPSEESGAIRQVPTPPPLEEAAAR